jgi:hypothetical protein
MNAPVRRSKKGKTVTFEVSIWWDEGDQTIHIASNQSDTLITTVSKNLKSVRYHKKLFSELAKILKDNGAPGPA